MYVSISISMVGNVVINKYFENFEWQKASTKEPKFQYRKIIDDYGVLNRTALTSKLVPQLLFNVDVLAFKERLYRYFCLKTMFSLIINSLGAEDYH